MTNLKKLGICMDHAKAHLIELNPELVDSKNIESKFTHEVKLETINKGEKAMHHKEQQEQGEYYKQLGEVIKNYGSVILFGVSEAKTELLNLLRADHQFDAIKIEIAKTDKMTDNQQHAFVKDYFSNN